jgi:hypothetical protein
MKVREQRRKIILVLLLVLLCSLGLGYALLRTNLTINGTSKIKGNTWDIHFENLNVTDGSVELSTGDVAAAIGSNTTEVSYTVTLSQPGDYYEFTVDAVNAGSIDGMVESVTSKLNDTVITTLPAYLDYSVSYSDGVTISPNQYLKAGETETYKVRIEFKKDIESTDLPTSVQTLTLDFGVAYIQADNTATEVDHSKFVYTVNKYDNAATDPKWNSVWLNQAIHETIPYFETPAEALSAIATASSKDLPFYLKHKVVNGIVTEQYVEFVVTETLAGANAGMVVGTYTLRGERTYDIDTSTFLVDESYISPYYEANKETLKTAFGYATNSSRCSETGTGRSSSFSCSVSGSGVSASAEGNVVASSSIDGCYVIRGGYANCYWS